jgi:transposase
LRYPSDVTDEEWELIVRLIPPGKSGGGKRTVIMREVVNGLMYVLSTGCQWRAIPKDLPPKSTVYDYFDLWTYDGTLDDYPLFRGKPYEQWENELLSHARANPVFSFGLHDCYAGRWLARYRDLLSKLADIKSFATADEICDCMFLNGPAFS